MIEQERYRATIVVEISSGELLDRLSILRLKAERIRVQETLTCVQRELDPMLPSTGDVTWMIGVGATRLCDFKRGCDGELPGSTAVIVPVDEVIRDSTGLGDLPHGVPSGP